ncbi:hypothetical protein [uncultured Campylobacter sp.]|nr:hypothetical protein [uncultured Campylobacter sp.]
MTKHDVKFEKSAKTAAPSGKMQSAALKFKIRRSPHKRRIYYKTPRSS